MPLLIGSADSCPVPTESHSTGVTAIVKSELVTRHGRRVTQEIHKRGEKDRGSPELRSHWVQSGVWEGVSEPTRWEAQRGSAAW